MNCDHCGNKIDTKESATYYVAWCRDCLHSDWIQLGKLNIEYPLQIEAGTYEHVAYFWLHGRCGRLKEIPKRTLRNLPDVELCAETETIVCEESVIIPAQIFCKRLYYGIECNCLDCAAESIAVKNFSASCLCKKSYYGIHCNCEGCYTG